MICFLKYDTSGRTIRRAAADDEVAPLLQWLRESCALTKVKLSGDLSRPLPLSILRKVFQAIAANPHIREISSRLCHFPWPIVAEYFETTSAPLESLKIHGFWNRTVHKLDGVAAAAQAIGSSALKQLKFFANQELLQVLQSPHSLPTSLCRLNITFGELTRTPSLDRMTALISTALTACTVLTEFHLCFSDEYELYYKCTVNLTRWGHIATGLQSNPSIQHFTIQNCSFTRDATARFLRDLSDKSATQNVRKLVVTHGTKFKRRNRQGDRVKISQLFCDSLLTDITIGTTIHGAPILGRAECARLFNDLATRAEQVRVSSIDCD